MEEEAIVEDIPLGDQFETVNNVVMLRITVRCEELLHNLEEEQDLTDLQECQEGVVLESERHHVQIEEYVGKDHDANHDPEAQHPEAVRI